MNQDALQTRVEAISRALAGAHLDDAQALCRAGLLEEADNPHLLYLLAVSLQLQGQASESVEFYRRVAMLASEDGVNWSNLGTALREAGKLEEAEHAYQRALQLAPEVVDILYSFGLLLIDQSNFTVARETLLKAHRIDPAFVPVRVHAARACHRCKDAITAEELLAPWRTWLPLANHSLQQHLAGTLLLMGNLAASEFVAKELIARAPADLPAQITLAAVYERGNRLQEAEAALAALPDPGFIKDDELRRDLLAIRSAIALRRNDNSATRELLEQAKQLGRDNAHHYFAFAQLCDRENDVAGAMEALQIAHEKQMSDLKTEAPERFENDAVLLPASERWVNARDYARWPRLATDPSRPSPIFIVGFPRSGTTLLEQMLDAHPAQQSMDEQPFFNFIAERIEERGLAVPGDLDKLDAGHCGELRAYYWRLVSERIRLDPTKRLVDKNPLNMLWLPLIYRVFPDAPLILALRHPCDVVLSCYMQNFRSAVLGVACSSIERTAAAYEVAMKHWLHHAALIKPRVLELRNEDLIADVHAQAGRIAAFLGLNDSAPLLDFDRHARAKGYISTPSYAQVIEPLNNRGVGRWQRYRAYLEPILPTLRPLIAHWGYEA